MSENIIIAICRGIVIAIVYSVVFCIEVVFDSL